MLGAAQLYRGGCGQATPRRGFKTGRTGGGSESGRKRFPIPAWGAWPAHSPRGQPISLPALCPHLPTPASVWRVVLGSGGVRPGSLLSTAEGVGPPRWVCAHPGSAPRLSCTAWFCSPGAGWSWPWTLRPGSPGHLLCHLQDRRTGRVNSLGAGRGAQAVGRRILPQSLRLQECWVKRGVGGQAPGRPAFHGGMRPPCPLPPTLPIRSQPRHHSRPAGAHTLLLCTPGPRRGQAAAWLSPAHGQVDRRLL